MDDETRQMRQPEGVVGVNFCTYVHGQGFNIRAIGVPSSDPGDFLRWLEMNGLRCEHSQPAMWIFTGYFPNEPDSVFVHVTTDIHEVGDIIEKPRMIRLYGAEQKATLVPVNPVTRDGQESVDEFNNWIEHNLGLAERKDFSVLNDTSFDGFDDLLRQAAEETNKESE